MTLGLAALVVAAIGLPHLLRLEPFSPALAATISVVLGLWRTGPRVRQPRIVVSAGALPHRAGQRHLQGVVTRRVRLLLDAEAPPRRREASVRLLATAMITITVPAVGALPATAHDGYHETRSAPAAQHCAHEAADAVGEVDDRPPDSYGSSSRRSIEG